MTPPLFDARNDLPTASTISTFSLRRRTPGSFVLVVCPQIGRSLKCQGQLEAAAAVVLAGCPEVKTVQEQPLKIWYSWRNTMDDLDVQILRHPPKTRYPAVPRNHPVGPLLTNWPAFDSAISRRTSEVRLAGFSHRLGA
jgi:hypothetical protein